MSLSMQRFEQLVEAYGSDTQRWPADEREAALQLLHRSPEAVILLQQSAWLDSALDQYDTPAFEQLDSRILQQSLPARRSGLLERCLGWLVPPSVSLANLWRPTALACLPLMMGLFMGLQTQLFSDPAAEMFAFETEETELLLISFADYAEPLE